MGVSQENIQLVSYVFCLPCSLLVNFGLFQYLLFVFYKRRQERLVRLLLGVALISFASLVPGAHPNHKLVSDLFDISDVCSVLSFLLQITVITGDVNKKFKIPAVARLSRVTQLLVVVNFAVFLMNIIDIAVPELNIDAIELLDIITEYISLVFVMGFRFYFLAMARGPAKVWQNQKLEVFFYLLLATHAVPFAILNKATGLDWHLVQGLWMRCTIALCLSSTIHARLSSGSSSASQNMSRTKVRDRNTGDGPSARNLVTSGNSSRLSSIHPTPPSRWSSVRRHLTKSQP
ncbi:hypothetical protein PF005_g11909 [Phytophthora fragariae]|uniref:Intimal thickness related receptor IRP domain-containing protein n=1 Tax=Phytophthora fragariae TaxID=53985 RepID=A0A6A3RP89_9STRA|nr:hypothetical protein PF003_g28707 [Phytophthora fragariae]KAE8934529.1 hypothetical protein PF009_g15495 [Phytophthora fragariae]KAE8997171.1 hypothetical protein PF011_g15593 [Phytophthora fragariae]KAE9078867.1 hypothetical protein PF010_g22969 [Phytophthora fragariae]KAE9100419.1 hypothetical protein PF006_g22901 [Phytophthora fragariae]